MASLQRARTAGLVIMFALLSGTAAYFGTKTVILEGKLHQASPKPSGSASSAAPSQPAAAPNPSTSGVPSATPAAPAPDVAANDRLSQPAQTYTVVEGDTLYPIGLKLKIDWQQLAAVNNLASPYVLQIGQVLVVPAYDATTTTYSVAFTADPGQAQTDQTQANQGQMAWRTDPAATAGAEAGGVYGLTKADDYRLSSRDDTAGTAVVLASHLNGTAVVTYEIHLQQPAVKGPTGIWAIVSLTRKK